MILDEIKRLRSLAKLKVLKKYAHDKDSKLELVLI